MKNQIVQATWIVMVFLIASCGQTKKEEVKQTVKEKTTWAEKLGYPAGKKVIMLHADDAGMCEEANIAVKQLLLDGNIQSAAAMPPCPWFEDMIEWAKAHPEKDVGLHLSLTSEWKTYRWGPVAPAEDVPGLIDEEGKLWHEVPQVVQHANAKEVATEIRAQIEKSLALGYRPSHIDTHMGTLYGSPAFAREFLKIAMEYGIPANALNMSDSAVVAHFKQAGYPVSDEMVKYMESYTMPKLDFFTSAPKGDTYEHKIEAFKQLIKSLPTGLTEIIFHPSVETENLKTITNSWQQRNWEAKMFADPDLIKFFEDEGIIFTNWKEIMKRFEKMKE